MTRGASGGGGAPVQLPPHFQRHSARYVIPVIQEEGPDGINTDEWGEAPPVRRAWSVAY